MKPEAEPKSFLKRILASDGLSRLCMAILCPPLAVADKGCFAFSIVLALYFLQMTVAGTAVVILVTMLSSMAFNTNISIPVFQSLYEHCLNFAGISMQCPICVPGFTEDALNSPAVHAVCPDICIRIAVQLIRWGLIILLAFAFLAVFDIFLALTAFFFGIPAALIAILICLVKKNGKPLFPDADLQWSKLSRDTVRGIFVVAARVLLCYIFPPLAVADMGMKKMLFVLLLTLCGWYPGVIAVAFCVFRQNNTFRQAR